ncbi:hypothetical protein ACP4OV_007907 [Aristida adscensionis]
MEDVSCHAKRAKRVVTSPSPSPAEHDAGGDDLISGLCDDLLVRILELVADDSARAAVRTGALSRRWRRLWTRVSELRFEAWPEFKPSAGRAERFIAFVDDTLALRARSVVDAGISHLEISTCGEELPARPAVRAAEGWIRYALQRAVASFVLHLDLDGSDGDGDGGDDELVMALDELLVGSANLVAMDLMLGGARVQLPAATVAFESLTDLTLSWMNVAGNDSSGGLLAGLVSPTSCPRLQRLCLGYIRGPDRLLLEAGALSELAVHGMDGLSSMELRTPNLRFLSVEFCNDLHRLTVSAPRLEEIEFWYNTRLLDIHGNLSSVRGLDIPLRSHGCYHGDNGDNITSIRLLQRCSSATDLNVNLSVSMITELHRLDIIKDRMPQFHHVTSLVVHVSFVGHRHFPGHGVTSLLTRFNNLRYLSLRITASYANKWKSSDLSLAQLEEAEFTGLTGTECEVQFLQFVLAGATKLQKVRWG